MPRFLEPETAVEIASRDCMLPKPSNFRLQFESSSQGLCLCHPNARSLFVIRRLNYAELTSSPGGNAS